MVDQYTVKQHYLPVFLLDRFSEDGFVWCVDKKTGKSFRAKSKDMCFVKEGYEVEGLKPNQIEKGLSEIEGRAAEIFRKFDRGVLPQDLTHDERLDLCIFLGGLMNRTPFFDAAIKAGEPNLATDPEFDKLVKELRVNALLDENWALHFYTLRWFVIENKTEHEFMLSDCPILRINGLKGKDGGLGIFDNNVILVLPIGPKKILVMTQGPEIIQLKMDEIMVKVVAQLQYEVNRVSERFFVCRTEPIKLPYSG